MIPEEYLKLVEDIRFGRIYSSTETVIKSIEALRNILYNGGNREALLSFAELAEKLVEVRPTSALLKNSIREITVNVLEAYKREGIEGAREAADETLENIKRHITISLDTSASIAAKRIQDGDVILTNSYSIFIKETLRRALAEGKNFSIYVTESRPGSEGLKLAEEAYHMGIPVTLIVDSAVRYFMKEIDKVLLASEAVAANGAVINKVGTSLIALAANEARVRVFIVSTTLKFSPETILGEYVEIAEADPNLLLPEDKRKIWGSRVKARAPLFDVTPPEYIDAIITERGLIAPQVVVMLIREIYGWPPKVSRVEDEIRELKRVARS